MRCLLPILILLLFLTPTLAQDARELIEQGRPREALERIPAGDEGELLRLRAHRELDQNDLAEEILGRLLARREGLAPEIRRQLSLVQAALVLDRHQTELAERLLREALRQAATPDDRLEVLDRLIYLCLWKRDESGVDRWAEQAALMVPEVTSPSRVAAHQMMLAHIADRHGRHAEAIALFTGCRALYLALGQPVQAGYCTLYISGTAEAQGRLEDSYQLAFRVLQEMRRIGHLQEAGSAIRLLASLGPQLARTDEVASLLTEVIAEMPRGLARDRTRLRLADFWVRNHHEPLAREMLEQMLAEVDLLPEIKGSVMASLADLCRSEKRYDEALGWIEKALPGAPSNPAPVGQSWGYSRPSLLAARGGVEKTQRRYAEALQSFRLAAEAAAEPERLVQKVFYQGEALTAALKLYDLETARGFLDQGLHTISRTPLQDEASPSLINLLRGLTSYGTGAAERLVAPPRWLGGQNPLATVLLREAFSSQADLQHQMAQFDDWIDGLRRRGDTSYLIRVLFWKQEILQARGRTPEARQVALEAIALADKHGIADIRLMGRLSLAGLEYREGNQEAAGELLRQLAEIGKPLGDSGHRSALLLHAHFLRENGSPEMSLGSYQQAAELDPRRAGPAHYGKAQALLALSRFEEVENELERVEEALGKQPDSVSLAALRSLRGRLYGRTDRHQQAVTLLRDALPAQQDDPALAAITAADLARSLRALGSAAEAYQSSRQELESLLSLPGVEHGDLRELFSLVVDLALENGEEDQALRYLELSRSAELVGSVRLQGLSSADPQTERLLRRLEELKARLTALQGQEVEGEAQAEALHRVLTSTRSEFFAKLDQLKKTQPDFEALVQLSGADLSVLQKTLANDEVLLEYYPAEDRLYIFAVTSGGFQLREVALSRDELASALGPFVAQVRDPDSDLVALRRRARELGELLVPADLVSNRRRARLVPSGPLWEVPFEVLSDAEGRTLDERLEVSYLTSSDLLRTLQRRGESNLKRALLVGAPDGQDLPGARLELEGISNLLPGAVQLLGAKASGEALRRLGAGRDVIHLATHSGLGRGLGEGYLALSDGDFTLEDIYGLALRPGSLVVLSSCESALGKERPGREVTSLASAFNIAGASTVIASHWEVDDQETARLFRSFYGHLLTGDTRGEALRSARLELAKTAPHPYYWAAFSLFGRPD